MLVAACFTIVSLLAFGNLIAFVLVSYLPLLVCDCITVGL